MAHVKLLLIGMILSVGFLAPSARASCGDYATKKGISSTSTSDPMAIPGEHLPAEHGSPLQAMLRSRMFKRQAPPLNAPGSSIDRK
jgi:hypothetical protein